MRRHGPRSAAPETAVTETHSWSSNGLLDDTVMVGNMAVDVYGQGTFDAPMENFDDSMNVSYSYTDLSATPMMRSP